MANAREKTSVELELFCNTQISQLIFYATPQGNVKVEVLFKDETFWLSQKRIAELFGVDVRTINEHLKNIFKSGELDENPTIRKFRIVQQEGNRNVSREVEFYMLDAIQKNFSHSSSLFPKRVCLTLSTLQM